MVCLALGPFLSQALIKTDDFTSVNFIFAYVTVIVNLVAFLPFYILTPHTRQDIIQEFSKFHRKAYFVQW